MKNWRHKSRPDFSVASRMNVTSDYSRSPSTPDKLIKSFFASEVAQNCQPVETYTSINLASKIDENGQLRKFFSSENFFLIEKIFYLYSCHRVLIFGTCCKAQTELTMPQLGYRLPKNSRWYFR